MELFVEKSSMASSLRKKYFVNQAQPLLSNNENHYDPYIDDLGANKSNMASPDEQSKATIGIKDKKWTSCLSGKPSTYKGLFYSSLSSVFFSFTSVIVRYVHNTNAGEMAVLRCFGILIFVLPLVIYSREEPFGPKPSRHLLILRGLTGAISLYLRFLAIQNLPMADASVIIFSVPVFVSVLARIFLKEPCGFFHAFVVFMTLVGIVLLTKLPIVSHVAIKHNVAYYYGVSAALGSIVFAASVFIIIRKMSNINHCIIMFNMGWVSSLMTIIITFINGGFKGTLCGIEQWLAIFIGIFSFCGQMLFTLALKEEKAGPVSIVRAGTSIVLAFTWQILFFKEIPDKYTISGAALVTLCVILTSVRKWIMSLPEHSNIRKKSYLLTI